MMAGNTLKSENNLSVGYFADGPWSHTAFKKLAQDSTISIVFICARNDNPDKDLEQFASDYGIDFFSHPKINSDEFIKKLETYQADLFVSMSFNQIFGEKLINLPLRRSINCHAGKLPFYRGRNILNWALINDEKEFGITAHYIDEGIDTGDIIFQKCYLIGEQDDYSTLLKVAHTGCAEVLFESIKRIQNDDYKPTKQTDIHPVGFYCSKRGLGDENIDWNQTSRDLFNFIRAICLPGPRATNTLDQKTIKINKSKLIKDAPVYKGVPGAVVGIDGDCFIVKTLDSTLKIVEWEYEGKVRIGDRLL
jgi:methionyl-tRNA formyltransferase